MGYYCDYQLTLAGTDEAPEYLYIDDGDIRFVAGSGSLIRNKWPTEPLHDFIILECNIEDFFTVRKTFEVIFYSFNYDSDENLPHATRCIHTANEIYDN